MQMNIFKRLNDENLSIDFLKYKMTQYGII